jgi:hypothetical protein
MSDTQVTRRPTGEWITAPKSPAPITHANARSMAQKRWEKYRRAAVERIVGEAKSIDPSISTGADAFALVASKQYVAMIDSEKPRIEDLGRLGQIMSGHAPSTRQEETTNNTLIITDVPPDVASALAELMQRLHEGEQGTIEGQLTRTDILINDNMRIDAQSTASPAASQDGTDDDGTSISGG